LPTVLFHTPVLLHETLFFLAPRPGGNYVDATLGGGGHANAILGKLGSSGSCLGIDADAEALAAASEHLARFGSRFIPVHGNFSDLRNILSRERISSIAGIVFDLGVSSHQLDDASRGFSFRGDEALDMRMDRRQSLRGSDVVNSYSEETLAEIIRTFGEERFARKIAGRIVAHRTRHVIATTGELAEIVTSAVGDRHAVKSLARVFQAIRIAVNRELEGLTAGLTQTLEALEPGGRIVVISYHSLEDRIVKTFFREASRSVERSPSKLLPDKPVAPKLRVLTAKPVGPGKTEVEQNPRSRSAKLRAAERL
jgi:16S rRNA (cytosine1402-N4)-methyltransferase